MRGCWPTNLPTIHRFSLSPLMYCLSVLYRMPTRFENSDKDIRYPFYSIVLPPPLSQSSIDLASLSLCFPLPHLVLDSFFVISMDVGGGCFAKTAFDLRGLGFAVCKDSSVCDKIQPLFAFLTAGTVMLSSTRLPRFFGLPLRFFFAKDSLIRKLPEDTACDSVFGGCL